jgi:uncharacterized membrane protein
VTTRLHHVHAAVIHAPLTLIPAAALIDLRAVSTGSRAQARFGRTLWSYALASAAVAGVAGMAASQEVKTRARSSQAAMWLHGTSNVAIVLGTIAMARWRRRNRPTLGQSLLGLGGVALMGYASWLGGLLVYEQGAGVSAMPDHADQGVARSPSILSPGAPMTFLRDAARGAWWLLTGSRTILADRRNLGRAATGKTREPPPFARDEPTHPYDWPS